MKEMIKVNAYDCRDSVAKENPQRFQSCSKPDDLPYIWLLKPPTHAVDPVSLDRNIAQSIPYNATELSPTIFYNFIVNNLPEFSQQITTLAQLNEFKESMVNSDINKVVIVNSKKERPEIKAITSHFRERLLFASVPHDAHEVLASLSMIKKRPDLLVYQSFDAEQN